ncbi:MAG: hypothetical protein ACFBQW_03675 [Sphingomonadaceae bacterium]
MSDWLKWLIGLAASLALMWLYVGPLGHGAAYVAALEERARAVVAATGLPGIEVEFARAPLSRVAILSGPADDVAREGFGSLPGLNDRVGGIEGVAGVRWTDGAAPRALPLVAEMMLLAGAAYMIGIVVGGVLFGRRRRRSFLD